MVAEIHNAGRVIQVAKLGRYTPISQHCAEKVKPLCLCRCFFQVFLVSGGKVAENAFCLQPGELGDLAANVCAFLRRLEADTTHARVHREVEGCNFSGFHSGIGKRLGILIAEDGGADVQIDCLRKSRNGGSAQDQNGLRKTCLAQFQRLQHRGHTEKVYRKIFSQKENVVLIGMPACGKSTVGKLIAEHTSREFVDLDEEIVKLAGMSIPEIFQTQGEAAFRKLETEALKTQAQRNSIVLATGGGAILLDENVNALRRNGRLYFLDRPLEELLPTEDRPLASTREAIQKRFEERYDRYCSVADVIIPVQGDAASVASLIEKELI